MIAVCGGARRAAQSHSAMRRPSLRGAATNHALRRDQDARAERSSLAPPRALPPYPSAYGYHPSDPRLSPRTRYLTVRQGPMPYARCCPRSQTHPPRPSRRTWYIDEDWRRLDERLAVLSAYTAAL